MNTQKQTPEFLDNPKSWRQEARIFLASIEVGEFFTMSARRCVVKMQSILSEEFPGQFKSRIFKDGETWNSTFVRIKKN